VKVRGLAAAGALTVVSLLISIAVAEAVLRTGLQKMRAAVRRAIG